MRIDEIDILGDFKLKGAIGNQGQFLGLSGSELFWLDAAEGGGGGGMSTYGTRYVWCNSVTYSATMSGQILKNAYASASAFTGLSADTRAAVLISPGVYDFNTSALQLTDSFIDLVGISTNADSVVLKASFYPVTLTYSNVDSGLYNVGLTGGTNLTVFGNPSYLRWNNINLYGRGFYNPITSVYSFTNLYGEFYNIKISQNTYFGIAQNNIDTISKNISAVQVGEIYNNRAFIGSGNLNGTYSNINVDYCSGLAFNINGNISGRFNDIYFGKVDETIFKTVGGISGYYDNITLGTVSNDFFYADTTINAEVSNVTTGNIGFGDTRSAILGANGLSGIFENIKIGNVDLDCFSAPNGILSGTFSNIDVGNISSSLFTAQSSLNGYFKNIKSSNVGSSIFYATGTVSGVFQDIETGNVAGAAFTGGRLSGTFSKIKVKDVGTNLFGSDIGNVTGTYEDLILDTSSVGDIFYATQNLDGTFKNIDISQGIQIFRSDNNFYGTYENITIATCSLRTFYSGGIMSGTFSDIEIKKGTSQTFNSSGTMSGNFNNIEIKSAVGDNFFSNQSILGNFKDISVIQATNFFSANGELNGTFENIKIDVAPNGAYKGDKGLNGIFKNLRINDGGLNRVFETDAFNPRTMTGTFSNIYIRNGGSFFRGFSGVSGLITNIDFQGISIFDTGTVSATVMDSTFVGFVNNRFNGYMSDTSVDARTNTRAIGLGPNAVIERCKFLSSGPGPTITHFGNTPITTAVIYYTLTNYGITNSITPLVNQYNIATSSLT